jgi:hypothetical protein
MQLLTFATEYCRDTQVPGSRRTGSWTWRRRLHDSRPTKARGGRWWRLIDLQRWLADLEDDHAKGNARTSLSGCVS